VPEASARDIHLVEELPCQLPCTHSGGYPALIGCLSLVGGIGSFCFMPKFSEEVPFLCLSSLNFQSMQCGLQT